MTAEAALRQAEAEGLTLLRAESSNSGYKGVTWNKRPKATPYHAQVRRGGKQLTLGHYATAEEAALCYARSSEAQAAAAALLEPPPMTAEEALRQAEVEGLTLRRSDGNISGYKGVVFHRGKPKPYQAQVWRGDKTVNLGFFVTAEEAALTYARAPKAAAAPAPAPAPPEPPPMTAEAALRLAEAEGLTLVRSESSCSSTGYKGVTLNRKSTIKPYQAQVRRYGEPTHLGLFATAEEAALCYARTPEAQAAGAAAAAPPAPPYAPPPMMAEKALRQAEVEGLTLLRSERNSTGYKGVYFDRSRKTSPYQAQVWRGGKAVFLGCFATPEEAALVVARTPEAQAAVAAAAAPPAPPPMTAEEALRQAEMEGLTLVRQESSSTGYLNVSFDRSGKAKPYKAQVKRGGKQVALGYFATLEEAALVFARAAAAHVAPPQPPATSSRKRKVTSEEAARYAAAANQGVLQPAYDGADAARLVRFQFSSVGVASTSASSADETGGYTEMERRVAWINYYLSVGDYARAVALSPAGGCPRPFTAGGGDRSQAQA